MTQNTINMEALRNLKVMIGGSSDDLAELISDFVTTLPVQVSHMQSHAANNDWKALRISSHSCKSNSRDLGALVLGDLCAAVELQCQEGTTTGIDAQIDLIAKEAKAVIAAISKLAARSFSCKLEKF